MNELQQRAIVQYSEHLLGEREKPEVQVTMYELHKQIVIFWLFMSAIIYILNS